jgi:hypothetical protein
MRTRACLSALLVCLIFSLLQGAQNVPAQEEVERYFPETGHWVKGDFLVKYRSAVDPLRIYGYPITDAFVNQDSQQWVQYFEKARFELDPSAPAVLRVKLAPVGKLTIPLDLENPSPVAAPGCRRFAETGFQVCYAFLDFFENYGELAQFGYPISNFVMRDGKIVQYFQLARFEWRPELSGGERVAVSDLGRAVFVAYSEDPARLLPNIEDTIPQLQTVLHLQVRVYVNRVVMPLKGTQTFYVVVRDQNSLPVPLADVILTLKLPSGATETIKLRPTNENGFTSAEFAFSTQTIGLAEAQAVASLGNLSQQAQTSFRIWW